MRRDRGQRLIEAFVLRRCVGKSPEKSMGMGRISERAGQNLCFTHIAVVCCAVEVTLIPRTIPRCDPGMKGAKGKSGELDQ